MTEIHIRRAVRGDCQAIADLAGALNKGEGMTQYYRPDPQVIGENFDCIDIWLAEEAAEEGGKAIGFIAGHSQFNPHNGYWRYIITSLYVDPGRRGQGAGERLLRTLIADRKSPDDGAQKMGRDIQQFAIDVSPHNTAAIRLYAKLGFETREPGPVAYRLGFENLGAFSRCES